MKKLIVVILALTMVLCLAGCKKTEEPEQPTNTDVEFAHESYVGQDTLVVTVGDFKGEAFLYPVKLANYLGFFEEEFGADNIKIDVQYIGSGAVMVEALTSNQLSMSFLGGQPCFSGIANNAGFKVITMGTYSATDPVLLVAKDSDIQTVADLKGKDLAVNIGTDNHYQMLEMLALGGLTEDDVHVYNLKGQEAYAALLKGEIQCMQSVSPNTYKFLGNDDVRILTNMSETNSRNNQVLVASDKFIAEHPEVISRFLKVLERALQYYNEHEEECKDILAEYSGADRELMDLYMKNYDCKMHLNQFDMDSLASEYEFLYSHDMLSDKIDLSTIYDTRFLIDAFGTAEER